MVQVKNTYYVDVMAESVLLEPLESTSFVIHATEHEAEALRRAFEVKDETDMETYVDAHIPFIDYRHDPGNAHHDAVQRVIYSIIYKLGNDEARRHIEEMGILTVRKSDNPSDYQPHR